jgi:hypothetical protein
MPMKVKPLSANRILANHSRARWVAKGDSIAQAAFIAALFGIAA